MSETCSTCRHWEAPYRGSEHPEFGRCGRIEHPTGASKHDLAMAGSETWDAWLWTRPEFGCALWEPKQ